MKKKTFFIIHYIFIDVTFKIAFFKL